MAAFFARDHLAECALVLPLCFELPESRGDPPTIPGKLTRGTSKSKASGSICTLAVDSEGHTSDFMLSAKRDEQAAARFFRKVLKANPVTPPRVINVDKNAAYPVAMERLKSEQTLATQTELRQVKYLNHRIEQDHRNIKRIVKPMFGFKTFHSARRTFSGIEAMNTIRKGQVQGVERGDVRSQVEFVPQIFGLVA